jgi:PKD repeat protein
MLLLGSTLVSTAAHASINTVSAGMQLIAAPASEKNGVLVSDTTINAFNERQGVTLASPIAVNTVVPGNYNTYGSWAGGSIPAGTSVDSHIVHADHTKTNVLIYSGTITFQTKILGIIWNDTKLRDTDAILGNPTTAYPTNLTGRGLEIGDIDSVNWIDQRTISVNWSQGDVLDEMRVITDHNDPPVASAGAPYSGTEGTPVPLSNATATDPENDPLTYAWSLSWTPNNNGTSCSLSATNTLAPSVTCNDDAEVTATLSVNDGHHATPSTSQTHISIANVSPAITSMSLPTAQVALNAPVNLNAIFTDPGTNDTHTGTIDWGDTVAGAVVNDGAHTATGSHSYTQAGTYTVRLTVFDDNGGHDTKTSTVVVKGLPTADANGPYSGYEGFPPSTPAIQLTGTADDPAHETFNWIFTEHFTKAGTNCIYSGATTLTPTISCNDNAVIDAQLKVTDSLNQSTTTNPTTVTVSNAAPVVAVPVVTAPPILTGQSVNVDAAFTDAGTNDHHTATVNWGDGSPIASANVAYSGPGAGDAAATHPYAAPGDYTVTVTVTDDDGASSSRSTTVHVNGPPIVNVDSQYAGFEGTPAQILDATASDPDTDPLTTTWTMTYTGDTGVHCDLTSANTLTPSVLCNDDAAVSLTLTVTDGHYTVVRTTNLNIGNVSPVAGVPLLSSSLVQPGQNVTVSVPYTDAGTHDTHTASIDWGDGQTTTPTPSEAPGSGSGSVTDSHAYAQGGQYQITITILDDNSGGVVVTIPTLVWVDSKPVVSAGGSYPGVEGTTVTLSASASDADLDPLTTSWSFTYTGDPGVVCNIGSTSGLHPTVNCNDNATVTGVLSVNDGVWPAVTDTATVNIGNLPPTAGAVLTTPSNVAVGTSVNTGVTFNDPGTNDTHTATIDWGDGNTTNASVSEALGAGTASGTHAYSTPGVYTISVTITDDNGGYVVATASSFISVYDPTAGFITGSAHYTSPPGADPAHPSATGDAEVGMEVKYQHPTDTTPTGHTEFKYKTDSLEFAATDFTSLNIASSTKAYFSGIGELNGVSGYSFLVSVIDNSPSSSDMVRVKIWNTSTSTVVYDSQPLAPDNASPTTPINTGSIQIHT